MVNQAAGYPSGGHRAHGAIDVLLTTEGTYPFVTGGVSTWADQLIRGLPEFRFAVYGTVANTNTAERYPRPPNLASVVQTPLWGTSDNSEYNPRPGWLRRRSQSPGRGFREQFLPAYEELLRSAMVGKPRPRQLIGALLALSEYAEGHSLKAAIRDPRTWRLLSSTLAAHSFYAQLSVYETIDLGRSIYRYLAPLDYPLETPGLVHASAAAFCAIPAVILRARAGVPFLLTEHGVYYRERLLAIGGQQIQNQYRVFLSNLYAAVVAMAYHSADLITPVAHFNALWERRLGVDPGKIRVVPNGVDPDRFPLGRPAGSGTGPLVLVAITRLDPLKDIHTLLRAFDLARRQLPGLMLRIHGPESNPDYARSCYALAGELGLGEQCRFEGSTNDVGRALSEGDIAVLSSKSEGFPFAAVEALMAGRPMVATEVGALPEVVRPPFGLTVPPRRPDQFAAAICDLASRRGSLAELGRQARRRMLESFTLSRFLDSYRDLYAEVHHRARAA